MKILRICWYGDEFGGFMAIMRRRIEMPVETGEGNGKCNTRARYRAIERPGRNTLPGLFIFVTILVTG
jgi:hypothetical protein